MGLAHLNFFARTIRKESHLTIVFPDRIETDAPLPTMLLLHGLSDDDTAWTRYTRIEWYLRRWPLMVVMPDGHRSFYSDARDGLPYERFLIEDVLPTVERLHNVRRDRAGRCVSGLSMGGYGAVKLALKYPDLFVSATSHSGAFRMVDSRRLEMEPEFRAIFGGPGPSPENDCFQLAEQATPSDLPALRLDCGEDDFLLDANRDFHACLERLGIAHEYEEHPGAHTWDYWDSHIMDSARFHAARLGIEPIE